MFINGEANKDTVHMHNEILLGRKDGQNYALYGNMDGSRDGHTEGSMPEKGKYHTIITYMWNLHLKNGASELIYKRETESQT